MSDAHIAIKHGVGYKFIRVRYNGGLESCGRALCMKYNSDELAQKLTERGNMYAIGADTCAPTAASTAFVTCCKPDIVVVHCVPVEHASCTFHPCSDFDFICNEFWIDEKRPQRGI